MVRIPEDVDAVRAVDCERHLAAPEIPSAAAALWRRLGDVHQGCRPAGAAIGRFRDVQVDGALCLACVVHAIPGEVDVAVRVNGSAARQRLAELRIGSASEDVLGSPLRPTVM